MFLPVESSRFVCFFLFISGLVLFSESFIYQETLDLEDLESLFGEDECMEGALSVSENGDPIITPGSYTSSVNLELSSLKTNKTDETITDKSPVSSLYELAEFNHKKVLFTVTEEKGPSHKKRFTVNLRLGDEEYVGEGSSIKKAQQEASKLALNSTMYERPPSKIKNKIVLNNNKTPVQKLDNWARKHDGATVVYSYSEQTKITDKSPHKNFYHKGMYTEHKNIHRAKINIGKQVFSGEGASLEIAKNNAASSALESLQSVDGFCLLSDKEKSFFNKVFKSNSDNDSPISLVHEFGTISNMPVSFDLYSEEGPAHIKKFVFRCNVGDTFESFGEGSSKKIAKQAAAEKMIQKLRSHATFNEISCTDSPKKGKPKKKKSKNLIKSIVKTYSEEDDEISIVELIEEDLDPVSKLFQIQQAKHEALPVFTLLEKSNNEFSFEVSVNGLTAIGSGPNKKTAKKKGAQEMLEKMGYSANRKNSRSFSDEKKNHFSEGKETLSNIAPGLNMNSKKLKNVQTKQSTYEKGKLESNNENDNINLRKGKEVSNKMPQTKDSLTRDSKVEAKKKPDVKPKSQLRNLSQELGFKFQFSDYPKGNSSGFVSLLSLTTDPPKVCYGIGETTERAQDKAALSALSTLYKSRIEQISQILREENEAPEKTKITLIEEDVSRSGVVIETD